MVGLEGRDRAIDPRELEPHRDWGFSELQSRVDSIYKEHDLSCGYGPDTMLAKLNGNATNLKQFLRRDTDFSHIDRALANVFIWTATFANEGGIDIQGVLSEKFGQGCPHCYQMPCLLTKGEECIMPLGERPTVDNAPQTIGGWQNHFAEMYGNNYSEGFSVEAGRGVAGRILDEVGELIAASYQDVQDEQQLVSFKDEMKPWESEIADVLAWGFALANGLKLRDGKYSIGKSLARQYEKGCSYCGAPKCQCKRANTFIDEMRRDNPNLIQ